MDDQNVQQGSVSEGTESTVPTEVTTEVAQPQPLTEDVINQRIKQKVAEVLEQAKREIQSVKDKSKAEIEMASRRAMAAEQTLSHLKGSLKDADPETLKDLELTELRSRVGISQGMEQEAQIRQQQTEFDQKFHTKVTQHIDELGIDPKDKRLDWAEDAQDYLEKRERIDGSIRKIIKENTEKEKENLTTTMKDMETKLRKELGLDSVDTSNPVAPKKDVSKMSGGELIKEGLAEKQKQRK